ncbi:uncharacterized protein LOC132794951 [Drosophila nasuta]|uniref:uncharacterized protein LOC132794951 n=1 Tax=Drosophila nasuta TaxID=42062 RepID=UPI00295E4E32|nr:uncharacterized protein LOC132794951 [Drosophila nasuta]XP_060661266.1 uncharacterized protein LOC132794951 [Drosophila nasuta]
MAFPEPIGRSPRSPRSPTHLNGMENNPIAVNQKLNNVSSVLLYGIPIVSLYIEGQERLCLAQISNTLLKQFSYNEIHNRRVALGITCVQCTPVQLEILRRAGAMPVSSRRCGMITRREAERLCKSFLGDNTPPRLPDDFAFNVQHKCAWGCRGSFLPSRYNSSRAKCIKCTFCGMFFSPNKFIFHSHRLTSNDRYIQPDAANFNSWRRHMTLCGHGQDEKIVHAWEDVKAMFNGGTRKRLVGCSNSSRNSPNSQEGSALKLRASAATTRLEATTECEMDAKREEIEYAKKSIDHQYNYNTVAAAAAAVVGVTATVATTVGVPFNLHHRSLRNEHDLSIMPLSRNFVVDYTMWQQHQQQHHGKRNESCPMPWIRPEINFVAPLNATIVKNESQHATHCNNAIDKNVNNNSTEYLDFNVPSILNSSAFKPVVASTAIVSASLYATRSNDSNSTIYKGSAQSPKTSTVFSHNISTTVANGREFHKPISSAFSPILDSINMCTEIDRQDSNNTISTAPNDLNNQCLSPTYDRNMTSNAADNEDDEVVDIETTEDENQIVSVSLKDDGAFNVVCSSHSLDYVSSSLSADHSPSGSPTVDIDVDGSTTDPEDQIEFKSNTIHSQDINTSLSRSNIKMNYHHNHENDKIIVNDVEEIRPSYIKYSNEDTKGVNGMSKTLSRKKCVNPQKKNGKLLSKLDADTIFGNQSSLHIPFPVLFKSHLNCIRQRHQFHGQSSPNTPGLLYCCDTTGNANDSNSDILNA